jgi:hypothetical protein
MSDDCLPATFFVVGASKAGTTFLASVLARHADICMSQPKETCYLSSYPGYGYHHYGEQYYRKCFAHWQGEVHRGDASVVYMWDPASPRLIEAHNPQARILMSVRDPVARIVSSYSEFLKAGKSLPSLQEFVTGESPELAWVMERNDYSRYLQRYEERFGRDRLHVILHDRLQNEMQLTVGGVLDFLGLPAFQDDESLPSTANVSHRPRWIGLQKHLLRNRRLLWPLKRLLPARMINQLRPLKQGLEAANRGPKAADDELSADARQMLAQRCRRQVEDLEQYLQVDLGHWETMQST